MEVQGPSSSSQVAPGSQESDQPLSCENCLISYGDFCITYSGKIDLLLAFAQRHGLILNELKCPTCGELCRLDCHRKAFRCDKSYVTRGRRRKKCNFFVSCFKGTWFERSHLDIETNLKFVYLFLQKCFSYEFVRLELKISDKTICDWASFCREVLVSWVLKNTKKNRWSRFHSRN